MDLATLYQKAIYQEKLSAKEGLFLISTADTQMEKLFAYATQIREKFKGNKVHLCSIINAKSGHCSEDCCFCAQSNRHTANIKTYPLLSPTELQRAAATARKNGIQCFSIVTSGKGVAQKKELKVIGETLHRFKGFTKSASLGILSKQQLQELKNAGLEKYHHNLETAKSFFKNICSTHTYQQRVATIKKAQSIGLKICCGGIFGLGETPKQRVEFGLALRDLAVDSVPLNILYPVKGTRIYVKAQPLRWQDILKLIATFRFLMPDKTIGVMGGREYNLREHQAKIFRAGANSILIGGYLTTAGNTVTQDLALIKAAGLTV